MAEPGQLARPAVRRWWLVGAAGPKLKITLYKLVNFRPAACPEDTAGRSPSSCNRSLSCTKNRKLVGQLRSTFKSTPSSSTVFLEDEGKKKQRARGRRKSDVSKKTLPSGAPLQKDAICNPLVCTPYDAPLS
uniref:Uncharacterized protein n=1 Tax=Coccidioides posadasii RMSCC 3488 TaxID=454284 RepID=A0A0J6FC39_COCPO|nr:hypothetical protein CPAG_04171 [Coccidioides posadasii RMSCC 3488]